MHVVQLYKKTYYVPENWNEVSFKTLCNLVHLLFTGQTGPSFRFLLLTFSIPGKILSQLPEEYLETLTDLLYWTGHTPFFAQLKPGKNIPTSLMPPDKNGDKISVFELAWCHIHLKQLGDKDKISSALDEIFFTLCRKPGTDFSEKIKEQNQLKYKNRVYDQYKLLVALWFSGWYTQTIVNRNSSPGGSEEEDPVTGPDYGYFPLIYNLAKAGIYGAYEETCKVPAHTVFFNLLIEKSLNN